MPNTIQLKNSSPEWAFDGQCSGWRDRCNDRNADGSLYVRYLNWDGSSWNWNYNWVDNDWNANNPAALATFTHSFAAP